MTRVWPPSTCSLIIFSPCRGYEGSANFFSTPASNSSALFVDDGLIVCDRLLADLDQLWKQLFRHVRDLLILQLAKIHLGPLLELFVQLFFKRFRRESLVPLIRIVDQRLIGSHRDPARIQKNCEKTPRLDRLLTRRHDDREKA